jgi:hypothetical protein
MNITVGTKIRLKESVIEGYPRRRLAGKREIVGTVAKESYGAKRGQHTFTIHVESAGGYKAPEIGKKILRKGRNVYGKCQVLSYPDNHAELAEEKAARAKSAKDKKYWLWIDEVLSYERSSDLMDRIPVSWFEKNPQAQEMLDHLIDFNELFIGEEVLL